MRHPTLYLFPALLLTLPLSALADDAGDATRDSDWTGKGELGLAVSSGNSRSENLNTKLSFKNEDDLWKHKFSLAALRAKGEVKGDFDGDGIIDERFDLNANRYELGASSAIKMNKRAYWIGAVRFEKDDFASFEHQTTFSLGYGYTLIDGENAQLSAEIGPGYRRAKNALTGVTESDAILRGEVNYEHKLTPSTSLTNLLLVESGSDNTFAQNDLGVEVAINESFALKAGLQVRHNSEVSPGKENTDTLTTVNLVYNFK